MTMDQELPNLCKGVDDPTRRFLSSWCGLSDYRTPISYRVKGVSGWDSSKVSMKAMASAGDLAILSGVTTPINSISRMTISFVMILLTRSRRTSSPFSNLWNRAAHVRMHDKLVEFLLARTLADRLNAHVHEPRILK